ncbi:Aldehyde/histidinol dehydrogenase [Aspergillus ambiguus]|uniref:L-glutamate gamma-semialdehyde dehydrogenase n=1 Tax=Aspergillus ambiguus TaxID=176160 RepID=UPI003CCE2100
MRTLTLSQPTRTAALQASGRSVRRTPPSRYLSLWQPPKFVNEQPLDYAKGSPERARLTQALEKLKSELPVKVPLQIGGSTVATHGTRKQENPSRHREIVAEYATAGPEQVNAAVDAALKAKPAWEAMPFEDRAAIFLRAAELVTGKYRADIVAATMLGQGKNIWQAEIDAPAETADFFRCYVQECWSLYGQQPRVQTEGAWSKLEYRPLEGFVYAVAPFNFTALGATLVGPAALLGNVVIWKPSDNALHASWLLHQILLEAGLPKDVIQFLPGDAETVTNTVLQRAEFGALSFIGSTDVFKSLQKKIGAGVGQGLYNSYPRVVGETGGKNWGLVHGSANVPNAVLNTIRAAFEYQGQKCSANSRLYVAASVWPAFRELLQERLAALSVGPVEEYQHFVNAVIHERAYDRLAEVLYAARTDPELELVAGGLACKDEGYYVHPTVYRTTNPRHELMSREIFGPVLTVYVYPDEEWEGTLRLVDSTSRYALTGSIFATDVAATRAAQTALKHAAGMLYINTKCTGAVVGQEPFGGSRDSGTNDKTGTMAHLQRFVSAQTIKEEFTELDRVEYASNEV